MTERIEKVKRNIEHLEKTLKGLEEWRNNPTREVVPTEVLSTLVAGEFQLSSRLRKEKKLLDKLIKDGEEF